MLIFIYGENALLAGKHLSQMRDRFVQKFDSSGMNLVEFDRDYTLGDVLQAVASPPFLSEKRMVVVHDLMSRATKKADYGPWVEGLSKIHDSTIVVLVDELSTAKAEKHGLFKGLQGVQDRHAYPFPEMNASQLGVWARTYTKEIGLNIDQALLSRVIGMVGSDAWQLSLELDKLCAYAGTQPVTQEMVAELVRANYQDAMFDFIDAVSAQNAKRALTLLEQQRLSGSTDFHLFAMLARQVRLLLGAADALAANPATTKQELAGLLGVHPFVAQKTLAQARTLDLDQLTRLHDMLFTFDRDMKRGRIEADVAVDRLVAQLLTPEKMHA